MQPLRELRCLAIAVVLSMSGPTVVLAQASDEVLALRREVERLKQGQAAMLRELQELKRLLGGGGELPDRASGVPRDLVLDTRGSPARGSADAKVTLIEFSDYQCPFCGRFVREALPLIDTQYIQSGQVRFVVRDFPIQSLHPNAFKAAEAVHCAGEQSKYWDMHDGLFDNQAALGRSSLLSRAVRLGLDSTRFVECLDSSRHAQTVRQGIVDGQRAGVSGTPAFFVALTKAGTNEVRPLYVIRGAKPFAEFKRVLDLALAATGSP